MFKLAIEESSFVKNPTTESMLICVNMLHIAPLKVSLQDVTASPLIISFVYIKNGKRKIYLFSILCLHCINMHLHVFWCCVYVCFYNFVGSFVISL